MNVLFIYPLAKDENVRKIMREIEYLTEDCTKLQQMIDIAVTLRLVLNYFFYINVVQNK